MDFRQISQLKKIWYCWRSEEEKEVRSPKALSHISIGVVYASPGVVNIPPWVLKTEHHAVISGCMRETNGQYTLVFREFRVEINTLYAHQLQTLVDNGRPQLIRRELDS